MKAGQFLQSQWKFAKQAGNIEIEEVGVCSSAEVVQTCWLV